MSRALIFTIIFLQIQFSSSIIYHNPKCCKSDEIVSDKNSNFTCVKNPNLRLQIFSEEENVFEHLENGYCVDIKDNHFALFKVINKTVMYRRNLSVYRFPKCCPISYSYNPHLHSCVKNNQTTLDWTYFKSFPDVRFVKVGLPKCEIIVDYPLNKTEVFKTENNDLYVPEVNQTISSESYCYDESETGTGYLRVCENSYDICKEMRCIHKCCMDGQSFVNGSTCADTYIHGISLDFSERIEEPQDPFAVIHGHNCTLYPLMETKFVYHLDPDGVFHMYEKIANQTKSYNVDDQSYCVEHADKQPMLFQYMFFRCFPITPIEVKFLFTRWAMLASCFFLASTILIYIISAEISNLFGKILISYCASLLVGFASLSYLSFDLHTKDLVCMIMGFLGYYSISSSFTWLNVMCFDIFYTFSSSAFNNQRGREHWKRYSVYSLYAWGLPFVLNSICMLYLSHVIPGYTSRMIRSRNCILQKSERDVHADLIFGTIPLTISEIMNVVFFIKTIRYYLKVKVQITKMNEAKTFGQDENISLKRYKKRFGLIIKLWFIMGIPFLFEAASSIYDFRQETITTYIELVWDTFNCFQGVFIFIIFICKKKIYLAVKHRLIPRKTRKISTTSRILTTSCNK